MTDWAFILAQRDASPANKAAADKLWKEIVAFQARGAQLEAADQGAGGLARRSGRAILAANQQAGVPDLHLRFADAAQTPPKVGSMISVVGVMTDYSTSPFAFTMDKAAIAP